MNKLQLKLQNCYGIKKLEEEFDFTHSKTYAIYAPNGVMKTSFAKTFKDLSTGLNSKDLIFPERETIREIKKDNNDLEKEEVFVIEPYIEDFNSDRMSTLVANKDLKNRYDTIHLKIDQEKETLLKELKALSGLRSDTDREISQTFTSTPDQFYISLERIEKEVLDVSEPVFSDISYKEIFNDKVLKFLETKDFKKKIAEYIKKYDELIESSRYFKKGIFNHNNASVIAKSLMDNGFFDATHTVSLNTSDGEKNEIHTKEELEKVIEEEKNAILNNPDLSKAFEEIDNKLKANQELRDFRDYLLNHLKIVPELENIASFRQQIWISYLKTQKELYINFLKEYRSGKEEIDVIIKDAKGEQTTWISVISIFNQRFSVPFKLIIKNQDDVILKKDVPIIAFIFKDGSGEAPVEKYDLMQALSSGEKRALYLLNIIFEVQARKKEGQKTLFIVDDIADSFDYKNKYAIIHYLKEISEEPDFYQIILTHNFDFFRTIEGRKVVNYPDCLFCYKSEEEVKLEKANGIKNPFINDWKQNLTNPQKLVASIPFVRNIIEYTKGEDDASYKKLTSLLHWRSDSEGILLGDLKQIFESSFDNIAFPTNDATSKVVDIIFQQADACLEAPEGINLENKIVLSIAIRLKAEKFITDKINDTAFISSVITNQTIEFFKKYKEMNPSETTNLEILDEVLLMTPENIHLNSFMYEPILDMSDDHLKKLYIKISKINEA